MASIWARIGARVDTDARAQTDTDKDTDTDTEADADTHTRTRADSHARTQSRTHTHTHTHTHARTHARACTRTKSHKRARAHARADTRALTHERAGTRGYNERYVVYAKPRGTLTRQCLSRPHFLHGNYLRTLCRRTPTDTRARKTRHARARSYPVKQSAVLQTVLREVAWFQKFGAVTAENCA
jgi:hypothetical protein